MGEPVLDPRERFPDLEEALRMALDGLQTRLWTALPCIVKAVRLNGERGMTADLQPVVRGQKVDENGTQTFFDRKMLLDCPIIFPQGGGFTLTFPIAAGDEVLALFACRNMDSWWQNGGDQNVEPVLRMHSLADGFCLPGVRSQVRLVSNVSTDSVQLRNDAGDTFVELDGGGNANVVATGDVTVQADGDITAQAGGKIEATAVTEIKLTAPLITLDGEVVGTSTGAFAGDVTGNNGAHSLKNHGHNVVNVQAGVTTILSGPSVG